MRYLLLAAHVNHTAEHAIYVKDIIINTVFSKDIVANKIPNLGKCPVITCSSPISPSYDVWLDAPELAGVC